MEKNERAALSCFYDKLLEAQDLLEELQEDLQDLPEGALAGTKAHLEALAQSEEALEGICGAVEPLLEA